MGNSVGAIGSRLEISVVASLHWTRRYGVRRDTSGQGRLTLKLTWVAGLRALQ